MVCSDPTPWPSEIGFNEQLHLEGLQDVVYDVSTTQLTMQEAKGTVPPLEGLGGQSLSWL